ncbi:MAG: recombinase family protein [Clostridiales bacterium]|nr:recombinase family protein [Clostridiales bacterium]
MKNTEIVDLYGRVSTAEQAQEGYSIGEQKSRLEKYAEAHGWTIYRNYSDAGYSGGNLNRPGLQALLRDVRQRKVSKVVVYKLDRLSRSQKDTLYLIEDEFSANGVDFVSMTENFDTGSPFGRAMIGILSVFAQLEREQIRERMQLGLEARAKDGYYHGGPYAPIGYDYANGELVINEYEAMQVREIYRLYIEGMPVYSIYKYVAARYHTKYGEWHDSSVRSCLNSVVYNGQIEWKGQIYQGRHQAIIDDETFAAARKRDRMRAESNFRKHPFQRTTLLGGLLWCGNCGARYYCKQNTSKRPGIIPAQRYYTCYSRGKSSKKQIRDPNCKNKSYNVKDLDRIVLDEIRALALEPARIDSLIDSGRENVAVERTQAITKRLGEIETQINRLIDLYAVGNMDMAMVSRRIEALSAEREALEQELSDVTPPQPTLSVKDAKQALLDFQNVAETDDFEALKSVVHLLIDGIVINGADVSISWNFI